MSKRLQFIIGLQWVTFSLTQLSHSGKIFSSVKRDWHSIDIHSLSNHGIIWKCYSVGITNYFTFETPSCRVKMESSVRGSHMISESLPLCGGHWLTVNTDKDNQHNVGYWNQMKTIQGINERVIFQLTNSPVIAQMFELLKRTPIKKILLSLFLSLFLNILFWMIYMYIWNHFMFIKFQRCADGLSLHVNPITSER